MLRLNKCVQLYIGCQTNIGQLVGIKKGSMLIETKDKKSINEYDIKLLGNSIFLYLQHLNDLTEEQSKELIKRGIVIGRPNGYTFSNEGFLYLLALYVDLFGLINSGYAKNLKAIPCQES